MCRIVFECLDRTGQPFSVSMRSGSDAIGDATAEVVQAYRCSGIEVISATRIEELPVDIDIYAPAPKRGVAARAQKWTRPAWLLEKGAVLAGLLLSVIGFDDGFSVASIASHIERLAPAVGRVIHAIV